jgi:hypothetical protein
MAIRTDTFDEIVFQRTVQRRLEGLRVHRRYRLLAFPPTGRPILGKRMVRVRNRGGLRWVSLIPSADVSEVFGHQADVWYLSDRFLSTGAGDKQHATFRLCALAGLRFFSYGLRAIESVAALLVRPMLDCRRRGAAGAGRDSDARL